MIMIAGQLVVVFNSLGIQERTSGTKTQLNVCCGIIMDFQDVQWMVQ